jgi:hypothetical protein
MVDKICKFCGKIYEVKREYGTDVCKKRKYCSTKCSQLGQKRDGNWRNWTHTTKNVGV